MPATNTRPPANGTRKSSSKYRGLIIAISLFLLFNLLVLGLNCYTSQGLDNDAVSINLAGSQRMLSQRMTKVILGRCDQTLAAHKFFRGAGLRQCSNNE